ncbi:MAG TPA: hypothetical protein VFP35_00045 [Candidatus Saccharimonadales bacterium]|nr:hypothetical protein [Candidatus Saccharimonadales bacterium]
MQSICRKVTSKLPLRAVLSLAVLAGLSLFSLAPAYADNLAQGFKEKGTLSPGFLVSFVSGSKDTVQATPPGDGTSMYGVVIDPSDAPVTLNRQLDSQVFVAVTGDYPVLVSTERGAIHAGDYLSVSSTPGIAAEVNPDQKAVIGQALESFDGKKNIITNIGGHAVGKISVNIDPRKNPIARNDIAVPGFLRTVGQAVAGKPLTATRIYLSLVFLCAAVILSMTLLWAAVRGGMIALGRNPLNRPSILNSMFRVVTAAVLVFIIGLFGVYLLLRI